MPTAYAALRPRKTVNPDTLAAQKAELEAEFSRRFAGTHAWGGIVESVEAVGAKGDAVLLRDLISSFADLNDLVAQLARLQAAGVRMVLFNPSPVIDTATVEGQFALRFMVALVQLEQGWRRSHGRGIRAGLARAKSEGKYPRHQLPYPYKATARGNVVEDVKLRAQVRQFVAWRAEGMSYEQIYARCLRERIRRRVGRKLVDYSSDVEIRRLVAKEQKLQAEERAGEGKADAGQPDQRSS